MKERHSLFFPLAIVASGVIWLLINIGTIPAENLWALTHVWPFALIVLGVGLILRSYWAPASRLASAVVVVGAMLAVIYAQPLGWATTGSIWQFNFFGGGVAGSGKIQTETRDLGEFNSISIEYPAEVTILPGEANSVTLEADDNLLPQLATEVRGGKLVIENRERDWGKRVDASDRVKITITVAGLNRIDFLSAGSLRVNGLSTNELSLSLEGAATIVLTDLHAEQFDCSLSGAGSIQVDGVVENLNVDMDGVGSFNGGGLSAQFGSVSINGAGSATVQVEQELTAEINGAGSISYFGSPVVHQDVNGLGSVRQVSN